VSGPSAAGYVLRPIPKARQPVLDRLTSASRRFQVHALVELDVTTAAEQLRRAESAVPAQSPGSVGSAVSAGSAVSWTGFVIATVARAVAQHPEVNARKAGNRLLYFDRVDVGATVERHTDGRVVLDIATIEAADLRSSAEITQVLRQAKFGAPPPHDQSGLTAALVRLPGPLRRAAIRVAATRPTISATFGPAVGVTSIGMFTHGWGWAIPVAPLTLIVTVGAVVDRPAVHHGQIVPRPMLPLTLSFDHAVIDGAPAARFTETLRTLIETAAALDQQPSGEGFRSSGRAEPR
jgi:pyruvate/2-oxoglutarate dehydrogenase complex dihydrolipoamide acyltransferase (E2) component